MRDREGQCAAIVELENALHEPFPKTGFADNQAPIMVLNRPGDNLGSGGRRAVDQDDQGKVYRCAVFSERIRIERTTWTPAYGDHILSALKKLIANPDGLIEIATAVPTQIENEILRAAFAQFVHGIGKFFARRCLEIAG